MGSRRLTALVVLVVIAVFVMGLNFAAAMVGGQELSSNRCSVTSPGDGDSSNFLKSSEVRAASSDSRFLILA
jgi:hypothetical protein